MSDCETYEVEKIVDYRVHDGRELYKVRWAGFSEKDDTWEPYENLNEACRLMIKDMFKNSIDMLETEESKEVSSTSEVKATTTTELRDTTSVKLNEPVTTRNKSRRSKKLLNKSKRSSVVRSGKTVGRTDGRNTKVKKNRKRKEPKVEKSPQAVRRHIKIDNGKIEICQNCDHVPNRVCLTTFNDLQLSVGNGSNADLSSVPNGRNLVISEEETKIPERSREERIGTNLEPNLSAQQEIEDMLYSTSKELKPEKCTDQEEQSSEKMGTEVVRLPNSLLRERSEENDEDAVPPEYVNLPVKKSVGLSVEELDMAIFVDKKSTLIAELENFQDFRSAALQGNVAAVKNCVRGLQSNSLFHLDSKFHGKTLAIEICEMKCDDAHVFDDVLRELVCGGARLDAVDDVNCRTPLHVAVLNGLWCRVKTLLMLRSPVNIRDKEGKTPLEMALCNRASNFSIKRTVYLLLEHGADVSMIIKKEPKNRFIEYLIEYEKKVQKLFEIATSKVIMNMSIRSPITPIIIRGTWEFDNNNFIGVHSFDFEKCDLPNERCFYCAIFAIYDYHGPYTRVRIWGESPFEEISINGDVVEPLQPDANGFLYPIKISDGSNLLQFRLKPSITCNKLMLLTQVVIMESHKAVAVLNHSPSRNFC